MESVKRPTPPRPSGPSLGTLLGIGFALVAVCLGVAVAYAVSSIQTLSNQSERLLERGVHTTRLIEQLADQSIEVERAARQYSVVRSPAQLQVYQGRRANLANTMAALEDGEEDAEIGQALAELRALLGKIEEMNRALESAPAGAAGVTQTIDPAPFAAMNEAAGRIRELAQGRIDDEVALLQVEVGRVQLALVTLAVAVIASTLLAALAFLRLIGRPVRQLTASIDSLGRAQFDAPIHIDGPRDLQQLGVSLDWLRRRIAELETQKSAFVRHMSHELKSPLANIKAGTELLQEELAEDDKRLEITRIVDRNTQRLQQQIDELLSYAGWQEAAPRQEPRPVELHSLVAGVIADHAFELEAKRLTLARTLDRVTLTGDEGQLRTLVDNLVSNAIKYSPDGGALSVRLARGASEAHLDVEDQGPGVPVHLQERVFEPFFRGPGAASTAGTGIGLSLALAAARAHEGSISILDTPGGAHFRVVLPLDTR